MLLKELILTVSMLGGCGGLEKNSFLTVSMLGGCGGLEKSHFSNFLIWEVVVVLKELIFYIGTAECLQLCYTSHNVVHVVVVVVLVVLASW